MERPTHPTQQTPRDPSEQVWDYSQAFEIDDPALVYLDGNSLGRLPKAAADRVHQVVHHEWGKQLIGGWNAGWIDLPQRIGGKLANLIGCRQAEVVVADSTSVNLFKLATAALRHQAGRNRVLTDAANFPSDFYILESAISAAGMGQELEIVGEPDQVLIDAGEIISRITPATALVSLSHVAFRSGQLHDMQAITEAAHRVGALVLWDLSHSVGVVPIELNACGVDLAVGCTYKYLCGGPGAPAFLYCHQDLLSGLDNPIAGWFSHRSPFDFDAHYIPVEGIDRFLTGTPPIISLAAIEAGVDLVADAGLDRLRSRSIELTEYLIEAVNSRLSGLGFELRSPLDSLQRGSHVALGHPEARRITENLICNHRVVPDFRQPDNIRLGVTPLLNTQGDLDRAVMALEQTVRNREYQTVALPNAPVT